MKIDETIVVEIVQALTGRYKPTSCEYDSKHEKLNIRFCDYMISIDMDYMNEHYLIGEEETVRAKIAVEECKSIIDLELGSHAGRLNYERCKSESNRL